MAVALNANSAAACLEFISYRLYVGCQLKSWVNKKTIFSCY